MVPRTVLIADPDVPLLQALAVRLRSEQYEVVLAQNADQAERRAREKTPDLLILNLELGDKHGALARERVEAAIDRGTTPVIYLANDRSLRHEETSRLNGAFDLLAKPIDAGALMSRVRAALSAVDRRSA